MKRKLLNTRFLKQTALAIPAAALMLGAANGAQIGLNIQTWWSQYGGPTPGLGYGYQTTGWPVTATAFGLAVSEWTSTAPLDAYSAVHTNVVFGSLTAKLDAQNPWASGIGWSGAWTPATVTPGNDEVTWGYLDDSGSGPQVTISGLRAIASDYTIQTIAATGASQDSFPDVTLTTMVTNTQILDYTNGTYAAVSGTVGTSTVSTVYMTLNGNDSIKIKAGNRDSRRSSIAGVIVRYTPGTNPPLIETQPQAPTNTLYPGGAFGMSALASGTPDLAYQWRQNGNAISGATSTAYSKSGIAVGDSGSYDVVVTNAYGSATSAVVVVTVLDIVQPQFTQTPVSQSFYVGYPVTFTAAATGGQLGYQWKKGSTAIKDATNATYTISSITTNDAGTYTVTVANHVGSANASATLTVKVLTPGSYEAAIAQTKPALWFRYSDTTAPLQDTAANSGSLGASGTGLYLGGVSHPVAGALVGSSDTAANFSEGKVTVPFNTSLNPTGPFTAECWINPADLNSGNRVLIASMINGENSGNTSDRTGWMLRQNGATLTFITGGAAGYVTTVTSGNALTAGVWQHVAATYDSVTTNITILVNGAVVLNTTGVDLLSPNYAAPLIVGDRGYGSWTFSGQIDEVALYSTALTTGQLLAHYQNGTNASRTTPYNTLITTDGAVEYLRLDEAAFGGTLANAGTLGAAWNGTYADAGGVLGSPQISLGEAGPQPSTYPGFESTNRCLTVANGYATAPQLPLNTNTVTVTCWVNRQATSTTGDLSWPAWLGGGGMHLNNGTASTPAAELRYHWNGSQWDWSSGLYVPADVWTFCAMVVEPTKATFYMSDGTTLKSAVHTATHAAMSVTSPPGFGGNQPGRSDRTYIGQLDETTVYDRALTSTEINTLFMVGTGAPFQLQIKPGGYIQDTKPSGTLHHGLNVGASCTWVASNTDGAATPTTRTGVEQFTAATPSQITIPADADFNSTVGTIMFWMRPPYATLPGPGSEGAMLVDRRTSSGTVIVLNNAGNIFIQCANSANSFSAGTLVDDLWHHVAVTYDQSASGSVAIYVDGVSQGSQANSAAWSWPTSQEIELGRSWDSYWKRYDGLMDDFRIYNRILTGAEIASVQSSDALVDTAALKVRYNFNTVGIGQTVTWPFGTLLSSPVLGPSATWSAVSGATAPNHPLLPTEPAWFFRATP